MRQWTGLSLVGSRDGLGPTLFQACTWTNADLPSVWPFVVFWFKFHQGQLTLVKFESKYDNFHWIQNVDCKMSIVSVMPKCVNSSPPSAAYMRQWIGSASVQIMAITWTNSGLMLSRHLGTNFSEIGIRILSFSFKKMHLKLSSAKAVTILSRGRWVNLFCNAPSNIVKVLARLITLMKYP